MSCFDDHIIYICLHCFVDLVCQNDSSRQVTVDFFAGNEGTSRTGWAWLYHDDVPGWKVVGAAESMAPVTRIRGSPICSTIRAP